MRKKEINEQEIIRKRKAQKEQVAAIWTRVSSLEQHKNNCSIETQLTACRDYCKRYNIKVKHEFGAQNESAKTGGTLFYDMIANILLDPEINNVIVYDFDRFSRNAEEGIAAKAKLKNAVLNSPQSISRLIKTTF